MTDKEQINKCECTCDECGAECEPFWKKENKEQIIVNGVDIFDVIDKWASLTSNEWCCDEAESEEEYLKAESIKNYILDINKQLACKTQECEELKDTLSRLTQGVVLPMSEPEVINLTDRYRKALEEIEGLTQSTLDDFENDDEEVQLSYCHNISLQILDIIKKAKGEE